MPFVPSGKKAKKTIRRERQLEARDQLLDAAIGAVLTVVPGPRMCLQACFLLERLLNETVPGHGFTLRLGSLQVVPADTKIDRISFDPRGPDGIDGGFHAWLEHQSGELIDPSIAQTLAHAGYAVDPESYVSSMGKVFAFAGCRLAYEELSDLEVTGVDESEPHLTRMMDAALHGTPSSIPGTVFLDVRWKGGTPNVP